MISLNWNHMGQVHAHTNGRLATEQKRVLGKVSVQMGQEFLVPRLLAVSRRLTPS